MFAVNEIVKGKVAGHFVILAFRTMHGTEGVQAKSVNPANFTETAPGEMFLPFDAIVKL